MLLGFYIQKVKNQYYLLPLEWDDESKCPVSKAIHKSHIVKVMVVCVVDRPQRGFDGKIGCFPIIEKVKAIKNSRNRPAGTFVTKPINVTSSVYENLLIDKILPAIKKKWPRNYRNLPIVVQDDNARSHSTSARAAFENAAREQGLNIIVVMPLHSG